MCVFAVVVSFLRLNSQVFPELGEIVYTCTTLFLHVNVNIVMYHNFDININYYAVSSAIELCYILVVAH